MEDRDQKGGVRKRTVIGIGLATVLVASLAIAYRPNHEPTYKGKRLSYWVKQLGASPPAVPTRDEDIKEALVGMGTNAIAFLVRSMQYEPAPWRVKLLDRLPTRLNWARPAIFGNDQALRAGMALALMETNAAAAGPDLALVIRDPNRPTAGLRCLRVLGHLGPPALPHLVSVLSDTNQVHRRFAMGLIGQMMAQAGTNACLPGLLEGMKDNDPRVRSEAVSFVRAIAPEALTNSIPAAAEQ